MKSSYSEFFCSLLFAVDLITGNVANDESKPKLFYVKIVSRIRTSQTSMSTSNNFNLTASRLKEAKLILKTTMHSDVSRSFFI